VSLFSQEWINAVLWNNWQLDPNDRLDEINDRIAEARSIAETLREQGDAKTANELEGTAAQIEHTYIRITLGDFVTCPDGMTGMVMGIDGDRLLVRFLDGCRSFPAADCTLVEVDL
jgi:hypothetical protein